jgi:hypothetical protein
MKLQKIVFLLRCTLFHSSSVIDKLPHCTECTTAAIMWTARPCGTYLILEKLENSFLDTTMEFLNVTWFISLDIFGVLFNNYTYEYV